MMPFLVRQHICNPPCYFDVHLQAVMRQFRDKLECPQVKIISLLCTELSRFWLMYVLHVIISPAADCRGGSVQTHQ